MANNVGSNGWSTLFAQAYLYTVICYVHSKLNQAIEHEDTQTELGKFLCFVRKIVGFSSLRTFIVLIDLELLHSCTEETSG